MNETDLESAYGALSWLTGPSLAVAMVFVLVLLPFGFQRVAKGMERYFAEDRPLVVLYSFLPWIEIVLVLLAVVRGRLEMGFWPYAPWGHRAMLLPMHPESRYPLHTGAIGTGGLVCAGFCWLLMSFFLVTLLSRNSKLTALFSLHALGLLLFTVLVTMDPLGWMAWIFD